MANKKQRLFFDILGAKPIVFNPDVARIVGSIKAGLFISQILYWSDKGKNPDWIYKTIQEFEEETTLTRREQDNAIKKLKALGILEVELRGNPAKRHFKVNEDEFFGMIQKYRNEVH